MEEKKKLYRKEEGKLIAGVCAGIAEYFSIDVTVVRLAWDILSLLAGCGVIAYLIAILIMPMKAGN